MRRSIYKLPDGRRLSYCLVGQGKPLVCLHGWAMSAVVFKELAELLANDYQLFIPDLPGHGESSPPERCDLQGYAADLSSWLKETIPSPCAVLGWSFGGMLAMELARNQPVDIDKLVLVGTTPQFTLSEDWPYGLPVTQVHALSRNLRRRFETTLGEFFQLSFAGEDISSERLRDIRRFAVFNNPLPERNAALGCLDILANQNQRLGLKEVSQPVLILHGRLDQITPVAAAKLLAEELPLATFVEYPDASHGPFLSKPGAVADQIRRFC